MQAVLSALLTVLDACEGERILRRLSEYSPVILQIISADTEFFRMLTMIASWLSVLRTVARRHSSTSFELL